MQTIGKTAVMAICTATVLITGVAVGYIFGSNAKPVQPVKAVEDSEYKPGKTIAGNGDAATIAALKAQIKALEKQLTDKNREASEAAIKGEKLEKQMAQENNRRRRGPFEGMRERMEKLKKEDPKKYAEIKSRMESHRKRMAEMRNSRKNFISSISTEGMSAEQKSVHEQLQQLMQEQEEIEAKLHDESLSDGERESSMKAMFENHRKIDQLNGQERNTLMEMTVNSLGLEGEDAAEVTSTIRDIVEATSSNFRGGRMPPPQGNGGGGPGPR